MCESVFRKKKKMTDRSEDASGILRVFHCLSQCGEEFKARIFGYSFLDRNGILNFLVLFLPFAIWETASYYCPIS